MPWEIIYQKPVDYLSLAPYVPGISEGGQVVFQVSVSELNSKIIEYSPGGFREVSLPGVEVISHAHIDSSGSIYAYFKKGEESFLGVFKSSGFINVIDETLGAIGPLGPLVSPNGICAFRGFSKEGVAGIYTITNERVNLVQRASQGEVFFGLPLVNSQGPIAFRSRENDQDSIHMVQPDKRSLQIRANTELSDLCLFPHLNELNEVVFTATSKLGLDKIYLIINGEVEEFYKPCGDHRALRGALIPNHQLCYFFAYDSKEKLTLLEWNGKVEKVLLKIGQEFYGSLVQEFALNPASVNSRGELAVRVLLENGVELILLKRYFSHSF